MRISDWSSDVCSSDLLKQAGLYGYVLAGQQRRWSLELPPQAAPHTLQARINGESIRAKIRADGAPYRPAAATPSHCRRAPRAGASRARTEGGWSAQGARQAGGHTSAFVGRVNGDRVG